MSSAEKNRQALDDARNFRTTHWSMVALAGRESSAESAEALEKLCRAYWYPLYAYVRRGGRDEHEAKDLTQGFFVRLLEKNYIGDADARRGKFRTFLLTSLNHFLANEWDKGQRQKRGGGCTFLSLDDLDAEDRYRLEPADELTPEKIFERRWAEAVLEVAFQRLRAEFDGEKAKRFDELKGFLLLNHASASYAEVAPRLGMSEVGLRSSVHRLRERFRVVVRAEIAHTLNSPEEVDEEIRNLFQALAD